MTTESNLLRRGGAEEGREEEEADMEQIGANILFSLSLPSISHILLCASPPQKISFRIPLLSSRFFWWGGERKKESFSLFLLTE